MALYSSPIEPLGFKGHHASIFETGDRFDTYSTVSSPLLSNDMNFSFLPNNFPYSSSSVLSFDGGDEIPLLSYYSSQDQEEECELQIDGTGQDYCNFGQFQSLFELGNVYNSMNAINFDQHQSFSFHGVQESLEQEKVLQKRPYEGEDMQMAKKQCGINRKTKAKSPTNSPSKDTQSIAAKNRRERISERLKVLQELVPNGTKVDLVTMLEKAISYVKFLQLQVKVLATDEFWPAQGGKAPDIFQVKEALDAILSSHRQQNSLD